MNKYIALCLALAGLWLSSCGPDQTATTSGLSDLSGSAPTPRQYWESFAQMCAGYPSKGGCDDGDMVLFNGLLCATGDPRACDQVKYSQDSDGRWWRSPRRKGDNLGENNSFSRDMALGVMLYLVTYRDTAAADRWMDWVRDNRPCIQRKPFGGGCLIRGAHRFCKDDSDNRCTLTPAIWGVLGRVYQYLGMSRTSEMRQYEDSDGDALPTKATEAPTGYELHLAAVEVFLKAKIDASRVPRETAANKLVNRQPNNPFFRFLKFGNNTDLKTRVLSLCPSHRAPHNSNLRQWAWERDTAESAWRNTSGWDCIFMGNLIGLP